MQSPVPGKRQTDHANNKYQVTTVHKHTEKSNFGARVFGFWFLADSGWHAHGAEQSRPVKWSECLGSSPLRSTGNSHIPIYRIYICEISLCIGLCFCFGSVWLWSVQLSSCFRFYIIFDTELESFSNIVLGLKLYTFWKIIFCSLNANVKQKTRTFRLLPTNVDSLLFISF